MLRNMVTSELALVLVLICITDARRMIDLTHTLDENAPKYPLTGFGVVNLTYYKMETIFEDYVGDAWVAIRKMEYYEHQGTHIDAPSHFGNGRQMLHEIPVEKLIGPGVVIDVREKARMNPDYAVTVDDIREHEAEYGEIPHNAIIMMNSGWGLKYPNNNKVFGSQNLSDPSTFRFPGWSIEACEMLLQERQVSVLGVDTPSTDPGQAAQYYCHMYLQPNNVPLLEYVANLDSIPQRGTTIVLGSMKVRRGTGGPTRVLAILDEEEYSSVANRVTYQALYMLLCTIFMLLF